MPRPILIAGPTASGKSALALAIAERIGGVVVKADSMQVYREAPILTAQPSAEEHARVVHRLYGHVAGADAYSAGRFIADVAALVVEADGTQQRLIIVGGTGLYFKALLEGLSPVPAIPAEIRARWREQAEHIAAADLHRVLAARDAEMAERLAPADGQRIVRALEVLDATGRSLADWQRQPGAPVIVAEASVQLVIERSRTDLQSRADERFDAMMAMGALAEVRGLMDLGLAADLPVMRALGVRPLQAHLAGTMSLADAVAAGKLETRQYIKRQQTWLKRHMIAWQRVNEQSMEKLSLLIDSFN